jgi:hypothetical protein
MNKILRNMGTLMLACCLLITCVLPVNADTAKKLYFESHAGKMVWNNVRGDDGNWFMSFTNMVPGGHYEDQLQIENGSKKKYALYMQVIPVEQSELSDDLLELISMKVTLGKKVLYEGTASGKSYNNGDLQKVVYLGTYGPGESDQIQVDLELDKSVGIEYCDLLAKNDWKFMVAEIKNPDKPGKPKMINAPDTGDYQNTESYIAILVGAMLILLFLSSRRNRNN